MDGVPRRDELVTIFATHDAAEREIEPLSKARPLGDVEH